MWYVARPFVLVPIMSPGVRNLFIGFIGTLVLLFVLAIGGSLMYVDYLRAVGRDAEEKAREKEPERGPKGRHNAMCPLCKTKWTIPETQRGTMGQWTKRYECPNCGDSWLAGVLYERADEDASK